MSIISLDDPVFRAFVHSGSILTLKMMAVGSLVTFRRFTNQIWMSPEDTALVGGKIEANASVERARRAHLNDLENIPIYLAIGFGYALTKPDPKTAITLFNIYTGARILHTLVYAFCSVPQPARVTFYGIGYIITGYMAVKVFKATCNCC